MTKKIPLINNTVTIILKSLLGIAIVCVFVVFTEIALRWKLGTPVAEYVDSSDYYYKCVGPYEKFKKTRTSEGVVYKSVRKKDRDGIYDESFGLVKKDHEKRVFLLGGSVADLFGTYADDFSDTLKLVIPDYDFEVIDCGMGSYAITQVYPIFSEILDYSPDLIIFFTGNNKPWDISNNNLCKYPALFKINRALRKSRTYHSMQFFIKKLFPANNTGRSQQDFNSNMVFEQYLINITREAKKRNIPVIFCTLPANFSDSANFHIKPPLHDQKYISALIAMHQNNLNRAKYLLEDLIEQYPENPFVFFYLAKCYEGKNNDMAQMYFLQALDLEPSRNIPTCNGIIRRVCKNEGAILADIEKRFIEISPTGLVGSDYFTDHCHWRDAFNPLVGNEIIRSVYQYNINSAEPALAPANEWDISRLPDIDIAKAINFVRTNHKFFSERYLLSGCSSALSGNYFAAIPFFEMVHEYSPELIADIGRLKEWVYERFKTNVWTKDFINRLDAGWPGTLWALGEAFRMAGEYTMALEYYNRSIELDLGSVYPYIFKGITYVLMDNKEMAADSFKQAAKIDPKYNYGDAPWYKENSTSE